MKVEKGGRRGGVETHTGSYFLAITLPWEEKVLSPLVKQETFPTNNDPLISNIKKLAIFMLRRSSNY